MRLKQIKLVLFSAIILVGLFFFIQIHQTRNVEKQKTSNIVGKLLIDTTGKEEPIVVLCQDLVQVKMRNFSHFNLPKAQP